MSATYCYVVVRADIPPGYQIVQSAHAVAEHESKHPGSCSNRTMIVVEVPDEMALFDIYHRTLRYTHATIFFEPDIDNYTAFASSPSPYFELFADLPLAGSTLVPD